MNDNAIEVCNVKKYFKIYPDKSNRVKDKILFFHRNRYETHKVLDDISFEIKKGEAVGLIGKNGCGKSTSLKLMNRIMYPTSGSIQVHGKVSSLIELGAGFHPDMSGRENIYINASIFGLSKKQIDSKLDEIIEFSELEEYIDSPVRTYSSGMYMRLAFSIAINVEADILLIDEILAVGDVSFQKKCFERLHEIKCAGKTIVIVSHSLEQIEQICDRSIWIKEGKVKQIGNPKEIHMAYLRAMEEERQHMLEARKTGMDIDIYDRDTFCGRPVIRSGNGELVFTDVTLYDEQGNKTAMFDIDSSMLVSYKYEMTSERKKVDFYIRIYREDNTYCFGTTSNAEMGQAMDVQGKHTFLVAFPELHLLDGNYMLDVDAKTEDGEVLDSIHDTIRFTVQNPTSRTGICNMKTEWKTE